MPKQSTFYGKISGVLAKSTDPADVRMVAQIAKLLAPTSARVPDENGAMVAVQLPGAKEYESRNGRPHHMPTAEYVRAQITAEYSAERHAACSQILLPVGGQRASRKYPKKWAETID